MGVWVGRIVKVPEHLSGDRNSWFSFVIPLKGEERPKPHGCGWKPVCPGPRRCLCLQSNKPSGQWTSLLSARGRLRNNLQPLATIVPYLRPGNEKSLNCISSILLSYSLTFLSLEGSYLFLFLLFSGVPSLSTKEKILGDLFPFLPFSYLKLQRYNKPPYKYTSVHV